MDVVDREGARWGHKGRSNAAEQRVDAYCDLDLASPRLPRRHAHTQGIAHRSNAASCLRFATRWQPLARSSSAVVTARVVVVERASAGACKMR